jgi:hypothetical protein
VAGLQVSSLFLILAHQCILLACYSLDIFYAYVKLHSGSTLSGNHGVPRVHYKGKQGDFYIMVMDMYSFLYIYSGTLPSNFLIVHMDM